VGFNVLRFDYEVLHGYTSFDLRQLPTLDLMVDLANTLQHRCRSTPSRRRRSGWKDRRSLQAIQWFREGKLLEIAILLLRCES